MKKVVGRGWCGLWNDGTLGFLMPRHIANNQDQPLGEDQQSSLSESSRTVAHSDFYRVKVTVEVIKNKHGKPIVRRTKGPK